MCIEHAESLPQPMGDGKNIQLRKEMTLKYEYAYL